MSFDNYDELRVRAENQRTVIERELSRDNADSTTNIIGIILCSVAYLAFFFVVFNINQITLILSIATAVAYGYYIYLIASSSYVNRQYKDALVSYQNQNQRIISEIDAAEDRTYFLFFYRLFVQHLIDSFLTEFKHTRPPFGSFRYKDFF